MEEDNKYVGSREAKLCFKEVCFFLYTLDFHTMKINEDLHTIKVLTDLSVTAF